MHSIFFAKKNVLSREARLDFIEIIYLFIILKMLEAVKPDTFSFCCKDGIDCSLTESILLFSFFKLLSHEALSAADKQLFNILLYGPSLINRERLILPERFNRMISALKVIESTREEIGPADFSKTMQKVFGEYFEGNILKCKACVEKMSEV